jgi:dipeptidyl aminopeptidase/acylaminoacyl peptidase
LNEGLSGPGYGVVAIDFHGSQGYGQAFTDAIHQNWGGWPLEDLQKVSLTPRPRPQLDADRACALGGSYGAT